MADELNDIVADTTEEVQEETQIEETQETEEPKKPILEVIKDKIRSYTNKDTEPEEAAVVVPDDFSKAALNQGWSSDDINEFAKDYTEDELKEMIPALLSEDTDESDETSDTLDEEETEPAEEEDSQEDEKTKKLLARIEALEKAQGKSQEEEEKQELMGFIQKASQVFDEASKEFEVFGKTDKLPRFPDGRLVQTSPAVKARNEVFDLANLLKDAGMDMDNALSVSLNAFKGKNLTKTVKRNLIKDMKGKEKRLSGKRTSHESGTKDLTGPEVIKAILNKNNRS